jgi:hypothetical protein
VLTAVVPTVPVIVVSALSVPPTLTNRVIVDVRFTGRPATVPVIDCVRQFEFGGTQVTVRPGVVWALAAGAIVKPTNTASMAASAAKQANRAFTRFSPLSRHTARR